MYFNQLIEYTEFSLLIFSVSQSFISSTYITADSSSNLNQQVSVHPQTTEFPVTCNALLTNLVTPIYNDQEWVDIDDKDEENTAITENVQEVMNKFLSKSTPDVGSGRESHCRVNHNRLDFLKSKHTHFLTRFEIAVLLVFIRQKHRLTLSCLNSICRLLRLLAVKNAPTNSNSVKKLISKRTSKFFYSKKDVICPSCHGVSENSRFCPNSSCKSRHVYERTPTTNLTFQIQPQICSILARNHKLLKPSLDLSRISDIVDSSSYRHIFNQESSSFITLLMNSDGVLLKKISYSIWITCFAINELPANVRFDPENIIVAMISHSSAKAKLKRDEMQILLNSLVDQLIVLEQEGVVVSENNTHDVDVKITGKFEEKKYKVYLFGGVCDKPAISMLTNMIVCTGYYGCNLCTIEG
ncbi:unnamed protein product [Rotaria sp. Silwood2]|nr:unnamed protein product [Rotaria sp. Silwood2]CAF4405175.1 unnamed protein product [Rotaria sp. Silwood2]